jgi:hypothetical protein
MQSCELIQSIIHGFFTVCAHKSQVTSALLCHSNCRGANGIDVLALTGYNNDDIDDPKVQLLIKLRSGQDLLFSFIVLVDAS